MRTAILRAQVDRPARRRHQHNQVDDGDGAMTPRTHPGDDLAAIHAELSLVHAAIMTKIEADLDFVSADALEGACVVLQRAIARLRELSNDVAPAAAREA